MYKMIFQTAKDYNDKYGFVIVSESLNRTPKCRGYHKFTKANCIEVQERQLKAGGNISTLTGSASGYAVIDIDMDKDGSDTNIRLWRRLAESHMFPPTWCVRSGSGGLHIYYRWKPEYDKFVSKKYGIRSDITGEQLVFEFKGQGGKVILPPSIHHRTGDRYQWLSDPDSVELADLPDIIIKALDFYSEAQSPDLLDTDDDDIRAFEQSEWYDREHLRRIGTDSQGRTNYRTPKPYYCKVCEREHTKLNHVPFLWKTNEGLFFTCRKKPHGKTKCIISYSQGIARCIHGVEKDTAKYLIQYVLKDKYKCCSEKDKLYYYFNGNIWRKDEDGTYIYRIISDQFYPQVEAYCESKHREVKELQQQIINATSDEEKQRLTQEAESISATLKKADKFKKSCNKKCFINEVHWHIGMTLQDLTFYSKLDTNPDLLAFNDCIYDLSTKKARLGLPSDYVSLCTGYDYPTAYGEYKDDVYYFFKQLYPVDTLRQYMIKQMAQTLCGKRRKSVHFHTGDGNNGKSTIFNLLQMCLGEYACKIQNNVFTQTNSDSVGKPEYDKLKGVRLAYASEPKASSRINESFVKDFTGEKS
jgi:hypothetical protein